MNFIKLIKKVYGAREEEDKHLQILCFAGEEMVFVTDNRLCVYMRDTRITGPFRQVAVPDNFNEVDIFEPFICAFLDPEGDEVDGVKGGSGSVETMLQKASGVRELIVGDKQALPEKVKKMVTAGKNFMLRTTTDPDTAEMQTHLAKSPSKVKGIRLGGIFNTGSEGAKMRVPLNMFKKEENVTYLYCSALNAVNVLLGVEGEEIGAVVPFVFKKGETVKKEEEKETMTEPKDDGLANIVSQAAAIAQTAAPEAPAGVQTEAAPPVETPPTTPVITPPKKPEEKAPETPAPTPENSTAETVTKSPETVTKSPDSSTESTDSGSEEVVPPVVPPKTAAPDPNAIELPPAEEPPAPSGDSGTPVARPENHTPTKQTDEERLDELMVAFDNGIIKETKNTITWLERLIKLQAKIIKKNAGSAALRQQVAELKVENAGLKKSAAAVEKAKKAMAEAMGLHVQ